MQSWPSPTIPALPGRGPEPRLHDTAAGATRPVADQEAEVGLYVCGITPYDATHLGHAATYLAFDLVLRSLRDAGHEVTYVQNVTDVDDPLFERAARDGVDWVDLGRTETDLFREDMSALRIVPPRDFVAVSEAMETIATSVRELVAAGAAYRVGVDDGTAVAADASDVYLDLTHAPDFGAVSHWSREEMLAVYADRGGDPDRAGKRDALDPLLWRAAREGEPSWEDADLGAGRPGWHIECTAIARDRLGLPFDLQGGGSDLVFPHHEMSAAQSTALGAGGFARHFAHQAMVGYEGEKMSKSKGNLVLVSRLRLDGEDPMAIRLALLAHHYRTDWVYEDRDLDDARDRLARWREAADILRGTAGADARATDQLHTALDALRCAVADDLDTLGALAVVDAWADRLLDPDRGPGTRRRAAPGGGRRAPRGRAVGHSPSGAERGAAGSGLLVAVAAPAEESLELARDRVTRRLREVGRVLRLLQGADVVGHLVVALRELVDAALPRACVVGEVAVLDPPVEQLLEPGDDRQGGLGGRRVRGVVGHGRPDRHRLDADLCCGVRDDPDDPCRPLVAADLEVVPVPGVLVVARRGDRDRPGVRDVGDERAEGDDARHARLLRELHELDRERTPAERRLDPLDEEHVATEGSVGREEHPGRPPADPPRPAVDDDPRPVDLEVVVVLRVEGGDRLGVPDVDEVLDDGRGRLAGVVPPLEGGDEDRVVEFRDVLELDHRSSLGPVDSLAVSTPRMPKAVLWDMDGTLVDTEPYWIAAEHEIVEAAGGEWREEYALELVGQDLMVSAELIRANSPVDDEPVVIVEKLLARVVEQVREHVPWRPGARQLLAECRAAGIHSALVTMSWRSLAEAVVEALPEGTFDLVITGDEVSHGKPHPEPYAAALRGLGVAADECIAIEDSPTGVRSAVAAGVPTLAVPHVVAVPEQAGALQLPSLDGMTPQRLGEVLEELVSRR